MPARFGIVIPVRRMPDLLPQAIESVLNQQIGGRTARELGSALVDLVVVVDDLDPETAAVLARYQGHLRWMEGDKRGQAGAVNKGFQALDAEIIKWLNADDLLKPGALQAVDDFFRRSPGVEFVYGDVEFIDAAGALIGAHHEPSFSRWVLLYGHNLFADPACFWKRAVHQRLGWISEQYKYSLDYEFWVRCARRGVRFGQIRAPLAQFRITGDNMSVVHHRAMRVEHYGILALNTPWLAAMPEKVGNAIQRVLLKAARAWKLFKVTVERGRPNAGLFARAMKGGAAE